MKKLNRHMLICSLLLLVGVLLAACGSNNEETNRKETATAEPTTRIYKDYLGHEVEIPVNPERVVYHGEGYGDVLALNIKTVGAGFSWITDYAWEDRVKDVEDVGFPINVEQTLSLKPDLIIIGTSDEKTYSQLSKIAPTIVFDTFAPLNQRLTELGDILNKKEEAAQWIEDYTDKADKMWESLVAVGTVKPDETASVLTYYPGDRLFVMARAGLSQVLYDSNVLKPGDKIQKILDDGTGFAEISTELLPEYAGDRIFILTPVTDEAKQSTKEMMDSPIWKSLPAVKNGHVYTIDIQKSDSDASTREWLLTELPTMLKK
ncbi:ABC transporter substrate-binding protein [Lysinibacillus fusiformis]|uniref:ABC transporter substrate-binding protein n=1 Tax=Lysinibacillus TaxID=400634 RepID=UPI000D3D5766|nr:MULTISPECIES: ABC transporter substrate-binding protein [Lysinibacillus]HAU35032.1 ferrichrome ABC transporter substrate-binding protein [Lysinibacillus sp.]MED4667889.1 ABC transporter substrate-binding protein [Lysinibacillus fusiformis]NOG29593.1 ABC transporter substrate-binding protein [Lysinibacillus fusiformis]QAS58254.1 ferrichrome ABC transporter substrate-binding protein [Lysinibacillus sphaericus]RDV31675.1 ferrichrome ABC transporter substrate-binding protein [Lysinibacillus fus